MLPVLFVFLLSPGLLLCATAQEPNTDTRAPGGGSRLIVLEKSAARAQLFDPTTRTLVATVPVGNGPHEVAVAPNGRTAVVSDYGDQRPGSTLTVINIPNARVLATIGLSDAETVDGKVKQRTFLRPHGLRFLPDGRHVVVTSEMLRRLLVVDLETQKVVRSLKTAQPTLHMVDLSPDGRTAYGTSIQDGSLGWFAVDGSAETASVLPTGDGSIWVGNRSANTISVVDAQKRAVTTTLETASFPIRVAFTADGAHALVSCAEAGCVQVFDAATKTLAHTVDLLADNTELSPVPIGICVQPDGAFAWIACQRGEFLAVIDLKTFTVTDRIPGGKGPDGMAFAQWTAAVPSTDK